MSPDGTELLFCRKTIGEKNDYRTQLVSVGLDGELREWTRRDGSAVYGRWSPDGARIAFLGARENEGTQLCLLETAGGEARALTDLPEGDFAGFRWSPDGRRIAFSFRERHPDWTEKARQEREEKGLSTPARVADNAFYRFDGEGFFLDRRHALFVAEIETGKVEKLYEGCPWGRYGFAWAPDGKRLAITRSFQKNLWRDPADDRLLLVDLKGKAKELSGQPLGYKTAPRWSPDGQWIAYLGNPDPLDHRGVGNTELFVAPARGGEPKRLTASTDFDLEVSTLSDMGDVGGEYLEWAPDSSALLVSLGTRGENQLARVGLDGKLKFLTEGKHVVTPGGASADGRRVGCLLSDPSSPAEPAVWEAKGGLRTLARLNAELLQEVRLGKPEEIEVLAEDGAPVHAWRIRSTGSKADQRPAVLEIHGGPQCQYGWTFFFEFQVLAAAGYDVVYSNPRGSKGYGRDHVAAIAGHWGGKDWEDVAAVKDWMRRQPDLDPKRLGVMGGSYGGYLTNWAIGHTDDFAGAITDRCVSNLLAKALNSDYPYYPGTYWQGKGYGPLEANADLWRDSPLAYFDRVTTPTLIIHSEGDLRCSVEQGEQVFFALQTRGVPSRFVRYPVSTSHGMSRSGPPDLRLHRLGEILAWWKNWLG
jgi:dipeptidyl aminopeptidase/acylaminoacyl peptidase